MAYLSRDIIEKMHELRKGYEIIEDARQRYVEKVRADRAEPPLPLELP
jgi:hypothetical protein